MGCGGYSKIAKPDVNGAVYRKITKEQVHVDIGKKVKINNPGPVIIFVYGGPGSKKGRLVSELVEVFDFTFINVEKIMLQKVTQLAVENHEEKDEIEESSERKESIQQLKKMLEDDPTSVTFAWILHEVTTQIDKNPNGKFLVDMMPNLKYLIRTATFSQDCTGCMQHFEMKYPISFAVYFSLRMEGAKNQKEEDIVKEEKEEDQGGFQSDEADKSRTKRRQSMFENSVKSLLHYFDTTERLIKVDVSSRNPDAISSRICEVLSHLSLQNLKLVNTVLIFVFDSNLVDPEMLQENEIELIRLERPGTRLSVESLEDVIHAFVNQLNHKEHKTFVVDLSSTNITKHTQAQVTKSTIVFVNDANIERYFDIPGCHGLFKAVSSLENAVCIFPADTNESLCKKIALAFNNEFSNPRDQGDGDV